MLVDISIVLYRPKADDLGETFNSLQLSRAEFRHLRILLSGSDAEASAVDAALTSVGLIDSCVISHRYDNIGFSSGHNFLVAQSFSDGATHCLVLNPDVSVQPGAIRRLVELSEEQKGLSLYGPTLERLSPDIGAERQFDSKGITWTSSGRHFDAMMGEPWEITEASVGDVSGLTGACLLVPRAAYEHIVANTGWFFDDVFLAYREDAELGIRASLKGVRSRLVEISGFQHVRSVRGSQRGNQLTDLLGVRNRFIILFRLSWARPGNRLVSFLRDLTVVAATFTVERSSISGLISAFRMRRFLRYTSRIRTP